MIKATEAKTRAEQRIITIAKEFIWNTVSSEIARAVDQGLFELRLPVPSAASYDLATEVAILLHKQWGYRVTTAGTTSDGQTILHISWRSPEREEK